MEDLLLKVIKELQSKREGVPTFVLIADMEPRTVLQSRSKLLQKDPADEIDIILHSPGGLPDDAYRLIRTFRSQYKTVNIIIPFWAKSAATLFAFGGSRIVFHEFGELGPIDAQIKKDTDESPEGTWSPAVNVQATLEQIEKRSREGVVRLFEDLHDNPNIKIGRRSLLNMLLQYSAQFYIPLLEKVETYEIGSMARYLDIGKMYAKRILKEYTDADPEKVDKFLDFLIYESPDHGYIVDHNLTKTYLPNVIKANEKPFSDDYNKILDRLSLMLSYPHNYRFVGFIDDFSAQTGDNDDADGDTASREVKNE